MACSWILVVAAAFAVLYYFVKSKLSKLTVSDKEHKYVLITGCDTGFGHRLALHLDSIGVPVFAGCLTDAGQTALRERASSRLQTLLLDVTSKDNIDKAYEFVQQALPRPNALWGLINNAGVLGTDGPIEFHTRKDYVATLEVNFFGLVEMTTTFLPLIKRSKGRIVNVSSIAGIIGMPSIPAYTASKWAVFGWSEALRREKAPWGIKVSILAPGGYPTNIADNMKLKKQERWDSLPEDIRKEYGDEYQKTAMVELDRAFSNIKNTDIMDVCRAHEHALFSQNPKDLYVVGRDATALNILSFLPRGIFDYLWKFMVRGTKPACLK